MFASGAFVMAKFKVGILAKSKNLNLLNALSFTVAIFTIANPIFAVDFLPFGDKNGDNLLPKGDDSFQQVDLSFSFPFFNDSFSQLYVNCNGAVSFHRGMSEYVPECGSSRPRSRSRSKQTTAYSIIAPYWTDVDARNGGDIFYRESRDPLLLTRVKHEVESNFPDISTPGLTWLFLSTWHNVSFFGSFGRCSDARNTFQLILATDGSYSFAIFLYDKLKWTTGMTQRSGGNCSGLGGIPAKSGFNTGKGQFFNLPGSCTDQVVQLSKLSNANPPSPGKWIFRIDSYSPPNKTEIGSDISSTRNKTMRNKKHKKIRNEETFTCDSDLEKYRRVTVKVKVNVSEGHHPRRPRPLSASPSFVNMFSNTLVTFQGPCLNFSRSSFRNTEVICRFFYLDSNGSAWEQIEAGAIVVDNDELEEDEDQNPIQVDTLLCVTPIFHTVGRVKVEVTIKTGDSENQTNTLEFYSNIYITAPKFLLDTEYGNWTKTTTNESSLGLYLPVFLRWDKFSFPDHYDEDENSPVLLSAVLLQYDRESDTWNDAALLQENLQNLGTASLQIPWEVINGTAGEMTTIELKLQPFQQPLRKKRLVPLAAAAARLLLLYGLRILGKMAYRELDLKAKLKEHVTDSLHKASCKSFLYFDKQNREIPSPQGEGVEPCPPTLSLALKDDRFVLRPEVTALEYLALPFDPKNPRDDIESDPIGFVKKIQKYNPGVSYGQRLPSKDGGGSVCKYGVTGKLISGNLERFHEGTQPWKYLAQDYLPRMQCCFNSGSDSEECEEYLEQRPIVDSTGYIEPDFAAASGDPHMTSFDQLRYSFNGAGEFWMIKSNLSDHRNLLNFTMQGRMEPLGFSASYFTAFVMVDDQTNTKIQVQLSRSTKRSLDVFFDDDLVPFDPKHCILTSHTFEIRIEKLGHQVCLRFSSGHAFTITRMGPTLSLMASNTPKNWGSEGLLGHYNGIREDDLKTPDGTIIPESSSREWIHHYFGLPWMVSREESQFFYEDGTSYDRYRDPSFGPRFEVSMTDMPADVVRMCGGSRDCLFDYAVTQDRSLANVTREAAVKLRENSYVFERFAQEMEDIDLKHSRGQNEVLLLAGSTLSCPASTEIWPCSCSIPDVDSMAEVECRGPSVTQKRIDSLIKILRWVNQLTSPGQVLQLQRLNIQHTLMTQINLRPLYNVKMDTLQIWYNNKLASIKGPLSNDPNSSVLAQGSIEVRKLVVSGRYVTYEGFGDILYYFNSSVLKEISVIGTKIQGSLTSTEKEFLPGMAKLTQLEKLDLSSNDIRILRGGQFRKNINLHEVNLDFNPQGGLKLEIGPNAFLFDLPKPERRHKRLDIFMQFNNLKNEDFDQSRMSKSGLTRNPRPITLHLDFNHLDVTVEEKTRGLKTFLRARRGNKIMLSGGETLGE